MIALPLTVAIIAGAWLAHAAINRLARAAGQPYQDAKAAARRLVAGEVTASFISYAIDIKRVNKLVVAEQVRLEHFNETHTRGPSSAQLDLFVPVEYHFYVDMSDQSAWSLKVVDGELRVVAPALGMQRPNPHWEKRREFVKGGVLILDEQGKLESLKDRVVKQAETMARRPCRVEVREAARASLAAWLHGWIETSLLQEFEVRYFAVRFADEPDFPAIRYGVAAPPALPRER